MNGKEIILGGTLKPDGTLDLDEKPNLPPGRVTVVLRQEPESAMQTQHDQPNGKPDYRAILLKQAGALADDDSLPELLASSCAARGRPEVEEEDGSSWSSSIRAPYVVE